VSAPLPSAYEKTLKPISLLLSIKLVMSKGASPSVKNNKDTKQFDVLTVFCDDWIID